MLLDLCCQVARTKRWDYFGIVGKTGYLFALGDDLKQGMTQQVAPINIT